MVREYHGIHLNILNVVRVVAQNSRQFHSSDLGQLLKGERRRPSAVLVPEPVTVSEVVELLAHNTGEGRSNHGTRKRSFGDTGCPEVDIFRRFVELTVPLHRVVSHHAQHVVPVLHRAEPAPLPPPVVGGDAVLPASLHVQSRQVQTKLFAGFLEQMISYLLGDRIIQSLSYLVYKTHQVCISPPSLVQVIRLLQHLGEFLTADIAMSLGPTLDSGGEEGVTEPEGCGCES